MSAFDRQEVPQLREKYYGLKSDLGKIKASLALAAALPKFFQDRITLQRAEEQVKRLLDIRVERFLNLVRARIYEAPVNVHPLTFFRPSHCTSRPCGSRNLI
jgi:hypothetical protein